MNSKANHDPSPPSSTKLSEEGYRRAIELMHDCLTEFGFLATPTEQDNYRRIWGRDSVIMGLAEQFAQGNQLFREA